MKNVFRIVSEGERGNKEIRILLGKILFARVTL